MPSNEASFARARIPLSKPLVVGSELDDVLQVIRMARIAVDGAYTQRCCRSVEERFGIGHVMMTPSCTVVPERARTLCGLGLGDEVKAFLHIHPVRHGKPCSFAGVAINQEGAVP